MEQPRHIGESKKVEYIELIYDLIFVFLLQQDNALLKLNADGFFGPNEFTTYLYSTLIVLQVWVFSIIYINRYGENSVLDHVFLFANMYLLYFMGVETRLDWWSEYQVYNTAWALILLNLAIQYMIKARSFKWRNPKALELTRVRALLFFVDAGLVFLTIPIFHTTGVSLVWLVLIIGFAGPFMTYKLDEALPITFEHLSERVMMFIVFTFGEMVVSISSYFKETFTPQMAYFSLTSFLMTIGLFMSYGYLYNRVMDRCKQTYGKLYLLLHVIIVLALSNVSVSLEHMRSLEIDSFQNAVFISASLIAYYFGLWLVARTTEPVRDSALPFLMPALIISAIFFAVILFVGTDPWLVIGVAAAYVFSLFITIVLRWRAILRKHPEYMPNKC